MRIKPFIVLLFQLFSQPSTSLLSSASKTNSNHSTTTTSRTMSSTPSFSEEKSDSSIDVGRLEDLKAREAELSRMLASVRREKLSVIQSRPLTIGVIGFGRFGQFIAKTFAKYGRVVATSRSDYTNIAQSMGVTYIPLSEMSRFMDEGLDVIVLATSILSFEDTLKKMVPFLEKAIVGGEGNASRRTGPLIVDVLSVKDYPRQVMLDLLPAECDILCTHPMFGPDSGKNGWQGLNFVYERTRIDGVILEPGQDRSFHQLSEANNEQNPDQAKMGSFVDIGGRMHGIHEDSEAHILGMDRMERFMSIWEEEGCRMVPMACRVHDEYAANSQFITHLMGRILGTQGLRPTPIDTRGFESVLKLIGGTNADSFDLFYGLYKYNKNSMETILKLKTAMDDVVTKLEVMEEKDSNSIGWFNRIQKNNYTHQIKRQRVGEGTSETRVPEMMQS